MYPLRILEAHVVGKPLIFILSLIAMGMPVSSVCEPSAILLSAFFADSRAKSARTQIYGFKGLLCPASSSIAFKYSFVISTDESFFDDKAPDNSFRLSFVISLFILRMISFKDFNEVRTMLKD